MERSIKVSGRGEDLVIAVDGHETSFSRQKDISANELYEALRYRAKDNYVIAQGDHGEIRADVFDAFYGLVSEIVEGINNLSESGKTEGQAPGSENQELKEDDLESPSWSPIS